MTLVSLKKTNLKCLLVFSEKLVRQHGAEDGGEVAETFLKKVFTFLGNDMMTKMSFLKNLRTCGR